ncbi:MAG: hypothetical protein BWY52_03076 [Chloroflexi bacterium ADurb.Bin325]|nr:MAG: hypothetical protein BWY52_03076 [Chloroflexi bacterium ADurb.Bin325]
MVYVPPRSTVSRMYEPGTPPQVVLNARSATYSAAYAPETTAVPRLR